MRCHGAGSGRPPPPSTHSRPSLISSHPLPLSNMALPLLLELKRVLELPSAHQRRRIHWGGLRSQPIDHHRETRQQVDVAVRRRPLWRRSRGGSGHPVHGVPELERRQIWVTGTMTEAHQRHGSPNLADGEVRAWMAWGKVTANPR